MESCTKIRSKNCAIYLLTKIPAAWGVRGRLTLERGLLLSDFHLKKPTGPIEK